MFPTLNHLNDLLPYISGNPQFRVQEQPNGFTIVCYMLQDEDTFRGEHDAFYKECRGITFAPDGTVASRTLHKFQNVGENEETQPDQIPWGEIVRIMDKRDGSMITPVLVNGELVCKTKKTFTSAEAIAATQLLNSDPAKVAWTKRCLEAGLTPTFEFTSPRFPIVLKYERDELTLLQIRDNITGEYDLDMEWWDAERGGRALCPFPVVENLIDRFKNQPHMEMGCFADDIVNWGYDEHGLKHAAEVTEGVEGWIVQARDGRMWKVKTKWYCDLHHSVTFTRWRDIARSVVEDQTDDLKGAFAMTGRSIEPILKVERGIKAAIANDRAVVEDLVLKGRTANLTVKDMALAHKGHPLFGLVMTTFRGSEVDWMSWYAKTHLDNDWSLEVVEVN